MLWIHFTIVIVLLWPEYLITLEPETICQHLNTSTRFHNCMGIKKATTSRSTYTKSNKVDILRTRKQMGLFVPQQSHNVETTYVDSTLIQRLDVESTLNRLCFNVGTLDEYPTTNRANVVNIERQLIFYSTCIWLCYDSYLGRAKRKSVFEHAQKFAFRSSCACANSHTGLCSRVRHSVVSNDSVEGH